MDKWVECICGADIHTMGDEWLDRSGGAFCYPIGVGDDSMVTHEPNEASVSSVHVHTADCYGNPSVFTPTCGSDA